jgi:transposase-like protein
MNFLSLQPKTQIIQLFLDASSMRSVERVVGCSINTITKLLCDVGAACAAYQDHAMRNLPYKRI